MSDADETIGVASTTPRHSVGSTGLLSYSSGSSISPSSNSSGSAKSAVNECLGAWLNYLQILNNLCAAGYRLAQTIATLEQWGINESCYTSQSSQTAQQSSQSQQHVNFVPSTSPVASQFINAWDDLARATAVATSTVKSHIVSVLQDFVTQSLTAFEPDTELRDHNQHIIMETTQTMINIQHQFCVASYDSFSTLMCCFMCQAPVGFPHDIECGFQKRHACNTTSDIRSQTPSPHFGSLTMNVTKGSTMHQQQQASDSKNFLYGSGSSSDHSGGGLGLGPGSFTLNARTMDIITARGPSPHHDVRGPSPIQGFLDNIRGPLPNPGHLLAMKAPFYRCSRSPLNFPLFPLNGQRRWSEAAAVEVKGDPTIMDAESQMRRWSMPWEASKTDRNTVTWHQTRVMPTSKLAVPLMAGPQNISKTNSDRSQTTTPDSISVTSHDGLAEAIQLLSCRPSRIYQPPVGPSFAEETHTASVCYINVGTYEMWSSKDQDRLPCLNFPRNINTMKDEPYHPPP